MTESTSGEPVDDEAVVRRVAARMRAAGRDVVTDDDPDGVRRRIRIDRDAMTVALWALRRNGERVPDAIDAVAERCTCGNDLGVGALPYMAATAIVGRVRGPAREVVRDALRATLADWGRRPDQHTRPVVELTIWRLADAVRGVLTDVGLFHLDETLSDQLVLHAGRP